MHMLTTLTLMTNLFFITLCEYLLSKLELLISLCFCKGFFFPHVNSFFADFDIFCSKHMCYDSNNGVDRDH